LHVLGTAEVSNNCPDAAAPISEIALELVQPVCAPRDQNEVHSV
jgi:hypothetical protein